MTASQDNSAVSYLEEETTRNLKTAKLTWRVGGGLVGFVFLYMYWIISSVHSTFLDPEGLASTAAGILHEAAPQYIEETKTFLEGQAPVAAEQVKMEILNLIPEIRTQGQNGIDTVVDMVPALEGQIHGAIEAHFAQHGDSIKAFYEGHNHARAADEVLDGVVKAITDQLDSELRTVTGSEGLHEIKVDSLEALKKIDVQLANLSSKSPYRMTHQERVQRRLIVTWMQALEGSFQASKVVLPDPTVE